MVRKGVNFDLGLGFWWVFLTLRYVILVKCSKSCKGLNLDGSKAPAFIRFSSDQRGDSFDIRHILNSRVRGFL